MEEIDKEFKIKNYLYEIEKYLRDIAQDKDKEDTFNADIKNIENTINKIRELL